VGRQIEDVVDNPLRAAGFLIRPRVSNEYRLPETADWPVRDALAAHPTDTFGVPRCVIDVSKRTVARGAVSGHRCMHYRRVPRGQFPQSRAMPG
jgi:hypothetical protein